MILVIFKKTGEAFLKRKYMCEKLLCRFGGNQCLLGGALIVAVSLSSLPGGNFFS